MLRAADKFVEPINVLIIANSWFHLYIRKRQRLQNGLSGRDLSKVRLSFSGHKQSVINWKDCPVSEHSVNDMKVTFLLETCMFSGEKQLQNLKAYKLH